jgi:hypothetical protein
MTFETSSLKSRGFDLVSDFWRNLGLEKGSWHTRGICHTIERQNPAQGKSGFRTYRKNDTYDVAMLKRREPYPPRVLIASFEESNLCGVSALPVIEY